MPKLDRDLKEACLTEALAIIDSEGVERLSLRDVARRLGVSHQAPYRHFQSRDHILAEIVARAFEGFSDHLDAHPKTDDPIADMRAMGEAYLDYAKSHPLQYRLMFGTPLPDAAAHPKMMQSSKHAFELLCGALRRRAVAFGAAAGEDMVVLDALYIWSGLHGLASIRNASAFDTLEIPRDVAARASDHFFERLGRVFGAGA